MPVLGKQTGRRDATWLLLRDVTAKADRKDGLWSHGHGHPGTAGAVPGGRLRGQVKVEEPSAPICSP